MEPPRYVAAVDLGSHTFCLVVARADSAGAGFRTVDVVKESVSLTRGLDDQTGAFSRQAMDRALAVLRRFHDRLEGWSPEDVRALGTSALRVASRAGSFLRQAELALGFPIEVIEGAKEAELAFVGAAHGGTPDRPRLVIDIGGGSTELAMGRGLTPDATHSEPFGHLERTKRLGPRFRPKDYDKLRKETLARWKEVARGFDAGGWTEVVGTGGTIRAAEKVLVALEAVRADVQFDALRALEKRIQQIGDVDELNVAGLSQRRRPTFPGGVLDLSALMEAFGVERVIVSQLGTREGILHQLLGHTREGDLRERTVLRMQRRYGLDMDHGERIGETAMKLADAVSWEVPDDARRLTRYAARLHEVGQALDHRDYERLGERVVVLSSMPGFGTTEQRALSGLVGLHRPGTKLRKSWLKALDRAGPGLVHAALLLRLSVLLHRARHPIEVPPVEAKGDRVTLKLPADALARHPLRVADLDAEAPLWLKRGFRLDVRIG